MINIIEMAYTDTRDARLLEACLKNWFQNPKDLHLTAPTMKYPFNFNKWVTGSYLKPNVKTYVARSGTWIIGHISMIERSASNSIHLFHIFVDRAYRNQGIGRKLVEFGIAAGKKMNREKITLNVVKNNVPAVKLYEKLGFEIIGTRDVSYTMAITISGPGSPVSDQGSDNPDT